MLQENPKTMFIMKMLKHFTMAALAFQTVMQGITKHYVEMLLLTDTSLQSVNLEMSVT